MKTITRLAMLAAVAAGFASCSIREMAAPEAPANRVSITVNAGLEQTKTVFGAPENGVIPVTWAAEGEQLALIELVGGVRSQLDTSTAYTVENGGSNAKFQFSLEKNETGATSFDYVCIYPFSSNRDITASEIAPHEVEFAWPDQTQIPMLDGPDPRSTVLFAEAKGLSAQPSELNLHFRHATAYGKINVKGLNLVAGEKAERMNITFPEDTLVGRYAYMPDGSIVHMRGANKILKLSVREVAKNSADFSAWFATKPFVFNAASTATVVVTTNMRSFSKTITAPSDMDFAAGSATAFSIDMSTATPDEEPFVCDKCISFDFSTAKATLPAWPTSGPANVDGEYIYPMDGVDYSFYLYHCLAAASQLTVYDGKGGSYAGLPVIEGYKVVRIKVVSSKGKSTKCSITSSGNAADVIPGGEVQTWSADAAGSYNYDLTGTTAGQRCYVYGNGALPIARITMFLMKDSKGLEPYEYPEVKPAFKPILNVILDSNCALNGNALVFTANDTASVAGAKIERIGGNIEAAAPVLSGTSHGDSYITTKGWNQNGAAIVYSTPLPYEISGKVRFAFSINTSKLWEHLTKMEVCWSTDGTNWTPVDGIRNVLKGSDTDIPNVFKFADNVHNSHRSVADINLKTPVSAGSTFYVKVESTGYVEGYSKAEAQTVRLNVGSILYSAPVETEFPTSDNIVYSENFASCTAGADLHIGVPMYYFANVNKNKLTDPLPGGIVATGSVTPRGGCICSNDNKVDATYITLPALTKLTEPTDVMLTFKEGLFTGTGATLTKYPNGLSVAISGPGEVGELKWKTDPASDYYAWHVAYVPIKGATAETVITMGNTKGLPIDDGNYYYLDDIVITK